jgi:DNA polymerase III epsilon subunit-like protein
MRTGVQVGVAKFLDFCLRVSEANGGAVPMLVAHNSAFDLYMLHTLCWQSGLHVPHAWRSLCTYKIARHMSAQVPSCASMTAFSLGELAQRFGCAHATVCSVVAYAV